jgi:hypothetical protein
VVHFEDPGQREFGTVVDCVVYLALGCRGEGTAQPPTGFVAEEDRQLMGLLDEKFLSAHRFERGIRRGTVSMVCRCGHHAGSAEGREVHIWRELALFLGGLLRESPQLSVCCGQDAGPADFSEGGRAG